MVETSVLLYILSYTVTDRVFTVDTSLASAGTNEILRGSFSLVRTYFPLRYTSVFFGG